MTRKSLFNQLLEGLADRVAADLSVPPANREALRQTVVAHGHAVAGSLMRGEILRLHLPADGPMQRAQRNQQILADLQAGVPPDEIARRRGVGRATVFRVRGSLKSRP